MDGKVVLVTGGSRGIGRAVAGAFAAAGAKVMICSRKADDLARAAEELSAAGEVHWTVANAGDEDAASSAVQRTAELLGPVDVLVNNAATNPFYGQLMDITPDQMRKTADVNQRAIVTWTQRAWETSMRDRGGVVLNIASIGGMQVEPAIGYYNATKAAVLHLTEQMAVELAPSVRVVAIAPGLVKTDMAKVLWSEHERELAGALPLARLGDPGDIAAAALFLASDAAGWITGSTLVVDGGQRLAGASLLASA